MILRLKLFLNIIFIVLGNDLKLLKQKKCILQKFKKQE